MLSSLPQRNSLWPLLHYSVLPLLFRPSSLNPRGDLRESACSVWWSASLREILTANHLSSCGTLLGFTFQQGAISYDPAQRAVWYLEWTAAFSLFWHTDSASDRFALCLLSVYTGALFSCMYACLSLSSLTSQNQFRWVAGETFSFFFSPTVPQLATFKRETVLLKMFPDQTQWMWRKCMWGVNVILAEQIRNVFHGHIPILVQA